MKYLYMLQISLTWARSFGFIIAAIAAALMSTVSTLLNAASAIWVNDVDRPVRIWLKKAKKEEPADEKTAMVVASCFYSCFYF